MVELPLTALGAAPKPWLSQEAHEPACRPIEQLLTGTQINHAVSTCKWRAFAHHLAAWCPRQWRSGPGGLSFCGLAAKWRTDTLAAFAVGRYWLGPLALHGKFGVCWQCAADRFGGSTSTGLARGRGPLCDGWDVQPGRQFPRGDPVSDGPSGSRPRTLPTRDVIGRSRGPGRFF